APRAKEPSDGRGLHEGRDRGLGPELTTTRDIDLRGSGELATASSSSPPVSARGGGVVSSGKFSKSKSVEELMDQAKNFVCRSCSTPVPLGHKFCGRCGAA